jgi:tetratricopeptide (TPR) repeat protein
MKMTFVSALILGTSLTAFGQVTSPAIQELHAGARSFNAGYFEEAQQHFQKAQALDPAYKYNQLLLARILHFQFRPGIQSATNIALARRAIAAYKSYLTADPENDIAFGSVAALYGAIGENELQRLWLLERTTRESVPRDQRATCYIVLASKEWFCSFKETAFTTGARKCVTNGLELIEKAIALEPGIDLAWFYKAELLHQMARVGEKEEGVRYEKLAADAKRRARELKTIGPGEAAVAQRKTLTGDEELDAVINDNFSLTYLAAPVPIEPMPQ